jgi:hypothetical protein
MCLSGSYHWRPRKNMVPRFFAFFLCATIGWCLYFTTKTWSNTEPTIDPVFQENPSNISEITMNVSFAWCADYTSCNYRITFRREGRDDYTSSVSRAEFLTSEIETGDIPKTDFERLAEILKSHSFFDLGARYPEDGWCTDCTITTLSAIRDGRRKEVKRLPGEVPLGLWIIQRTIEGTAMNVRWSNVCSKRIPIFR